MTENLHDLLDFAHELAWQAGKITLRYFQTGIRADLKADESPVTVADRATEQYLRDAIGKRFPSHAVPQFAAHYPDGVGIMREFRAFIDI